MAEVRYIPAPPRPPRPLPPPRAQPSEAETKYREARAENEKLRVRERELRIARAKKELIPREHCIRQATFLVIALRQRLLAIPAQHARELLNIADEREMARRLDAIVRDALSEIAELPLKVSDERWMQRLDELEATSSKRPRRVAK